MSNIIELFDSLRFKKINFGVASCLLLIGESGSGKSELAKYYVKNNPVFEQAERTQIPVLHFEFKSISTPEEFLRALLVTVGDPQQGLGARNKGELYDRLPSGRSGLTPRKKPLSPGRSCVQPNVKKAINLFRQYVKLCIMITNEPPLTGAATMATEAFTVRAESDIVHQLDFIAGALDRSRNYLVNQALREYLKTHAWQVEKITQGIAAADRGELIDHDDVMREMEEQIEQKAKGRA
ncbi:AAA family ATPase [Methylomonas albis]|uniref:AAA family ATPase n=1 Tax=Methylomonas albis TaxID=1854563 RepID=A0ABR9CYX8_9GAMM|nr:AAA family ATPase [Methylomonas albis]MBD9355178.1 AAA family ATPase [Methylomonas albis]